MKIKKLYVIRLDYIQFFKFFSEKAFLANRYKTH